jgi:GNAT superfamily N-acetyltransferase
VTWRELEPAEHEAVMEMVLGLYAEDPAPTPMTRPQIERTLRELRANPVRGRVVVWDLGSGPRGYALLCSYWSNELGGEVCIVDELYVQQSARGNGAATALVQGLVAGAWPWFRGAVAVELEVTPNNARARALYERLGFAAYKNALMRLRRNSPRASG